MCLLAKGSEEGQEIRLTGRRFSLTLGEPVRFNLLTSSYDTIDEKAPIQNAMLINIEPERFTPLPPYITSLEGEGAVLHANQKERIEVQLACQLTEVGTLKIECVHVDDESKRWALEFEVRQQTEAMQQPASLHPRLSECKALIARLYSE
ncbi:hypothetical protein ACT691_08755 [Vibrio metschnikovii]